MIDGNYLKEPRGIYRDKRNVREDSRDKTLLENLENNTLIEKRTAKKNREV